MPPIPQKDQLGSKLLLEIELQEVLETMAINQSNKEEVTPLNLI